MKTGVSIEKAIDALVESETHSNAGLMGRAIVLLSWIKGEAGDTLDPNTVSQIDKWLADVKEHQEADDAKVLRNLRGAG
jgi:hypothetical protein